MEKEKNNRGVIILLTTIIVILAVLCILFATGTISLKTNTTNNKEQTSENNTNNNVSYKVEDYVTTEKENIGNDVNNIQKVIFKKLDSSLTQKFTEEQTELIDFAKNNYNYFETKFKNENHNITDYFGSEKDYLSETNIWYQINKDILTVYYKLTYENEIGRGDSVIVTNIDLSNNKVLTNEEILKLGNMSFNDIAVKEYDRVLKSCDEKTNLGYCYFDKNDKETTKEQLQQNKDIFVKNIESNLEKTIKAYIQDEKIKYDYQPANLAMINQTLHIGGPFSYSTVEVGEYK